MLTLNRFNWIIYRIKIKIVPHLGLFCNIKVWQFIAILYIYTKIGSAFDTNMYINIFNNISIKMGFLEYKINSNNLGIILSSYRSILGFKTYTLMLLLGLVLIPLIFIIDNYIFIFISILCVIFIKAFMLNFYKKHFKFYDSKNKQINYIKYVQEALKNIRKILKYFLKLWVISIIIVAILRSSVAAVIVNGDYSSNILNMLIIWLPLPLVLYLLNFTTKYIKKEDIKSEDYYLYNDFVVERVNLYRIVYLMLINYIIRNYYHAYITITIGLIVLFIIFLIIYKLHKQPSNNKVLALESKFHMTMGYVSAFLSITPILQDSISTGYVEYYANTGPDRYIGWRKVFYRNPLVIVKGGTVNIMERNKKDKMDVFYLPNPRKESLFEEHKIKLANSPILNIAYRLKNNQAVFESPNEFTLRPVNLFSNNKFQGCVSLLLKGRFLVVTIVRHDLSGSIFIPSYHLPDKSPESRMKIMDTVNHLENRYDIVMPRRLNRYKGLIIFTQAESINNQSLFKVWRPTLHFTEPQQRIVKDYFHINKEETARVDNLNIINKQLNIVDLIKEIKQKAKDLTLDKSSYIDKEEGLSTSEDTSLRMAFDEYLADKLYRKIIEFYVTKGKKVNPSNYKIVRDAPDLYKKTDFDTLLKSALEEAELSRFADSIAEGSDEAFLNFMEQFYYEQHLNNNYNPKHPEFGVRRAFYIDNMLLTKEDYTVFFRINNQGVLEGYKERHQTLGNAKDKLKLPLNKSRGELIENIIRKYVYRMSSNYSHLIDKKIYAVNIDRLTFEFFELRPTSDIWGVILDKIKLPEGFALSQGLDENVLYDCEVYSIVDVLNNGLRLPGRIHSGTYDFTISKHDYNLFDDKDEHSIRRFMDFIYKNDNGSLTYQSDKDNPIVTVEKKDKKVRFTQEDIDYKKYKQYKGVDYTYKALKKKMKFFRKNKWNGHIIDFDLDIPLPDSRIKIDRVCNCCATWSIIKNSEGKIIIGRNPVYWEYDGLEPRYKFLKPKVRWFVEPTKQETETWSKKIIYKPEMATGDKALNKGKVAIYKKDCYHGHREEQLIELGKSIEHMLKKKELYRRTVVISRRIRDWEVFNGNKYIRFYDILDVVEEAKQLKILKVAFPREVRFAEVVEAVEKAKQVAAIQGESPLFVSDSEEESTFLDNVYAEPIDTDNYLQWALDIDNQGEPMEVDHPEVEPMDTDHPEVQFIEEDNQGEPMEVDHSEVGVKQTATQGESPLFVSDSEDEGESPIFLGEVQLKGDSLVEGYNRTESPDVYIEDMGAEARPVDMTEKKVFLQEERGDDGITYKSRFKPNNRDPDQSSLWRNTYAHVLDKYDSVIIHLEDEEVYWSHTDSEDESESESDLDDVSLTPIPREPKKEVVSKERKVKVTRFAQKDIDYKESLMYNKTCEQDPYQIREQDPHQPTSWGSGPSGNTGVSIVSSSRAELSPFVWQFTDLPGSNTEQSQVSLISQGNVDLYNMDTPAYLSDNTDTPANIHDDDDDDADTPASFYYYEDADIPANIYDNADTPANIDDPKTPRNLDDGALGNIENAPRNLIENDIDMDEGYYDLHSNDHDDDDYIIENSKDVAAKSLNNPDIMEKVNQFSFEDDQEYVQPEPESFLDFDPCGVDVDFYGYEYHKNVRGRREGEIEITEVLHKARTKAEGATVEAALAVAKAEAALAEARAAVAKAEAAKVEEAVIAKAEAAKAEEAAKVKAEGKAKAATKAKAEEVALAKGEAVKLVADSVVEEATCTENINSLEENLNPVEDSPMLDINSLEDSARANVNSEEGNNVTNIDLPKENNTTIVDSPVYPWDNNNQFSFEDDQEYVQPEPESFLDFDPCGVDVDFYGYEYHKNVRESREQSEGTDNEEIDGDVNLFDKKADYLIDTVNTEEIVRENLRVDTIVIPLDSPDSDIEDNGLDTVNTLYTKEAMLDPLPYIDGSGAVTGIVNTEECAEFTNSPIIMNERVISDEGVELVRSIEAERATDLNSRDLDSESPISPLSERNSSYFGSDRSQLLRDLRMNITGEPEDLLPDPDRETYSRDITGEPVDLLPDPNISNRDITNKSQETLDTIVVNTSSIRNNTSNINDTSSFNLNTSSKIRENNPRFASKKAKASIRAIARAAEQPEDVYELGSKGPMK